MKKTQLLEEINLLENMKSDRFKNLLKEFFDFKIVDKTTISDEEMNLFNQYIDKKITEGHKHYEFGMHFNSLILQSTNFFYEIEGSLIGVCQAPNGKEYVIGYRLYEYYSDLLGTNIANWIPNFEHGESAKKVKYFMKECHKLYGTTMELYDAADDDSKCGFDFS